MKNSKKELQTIEFKKSLTIKNRRFIELVAQGEVLHEAYRKAGYSGRSYYAPYELKSYLKNEIKYAMEANGISEEGVMIETKRLLDIPLHPSQTHITVNQKLRIANSLHKMIPKEAEKRPQISPIIIQRGDGPTQINIGKDTTPEKKLEPKEELPSGS